MKEFADICYTLFMAKMIARTGMSHTFSIEKLLKIKLIVVYHIS